MTDVNGIKILKKRGRKPKNKISELMPIKEENNDSEKEIIIAYLPISLNDIENKYDDLFIKSESQIIDSNITDFNSDSNKEKIENYSQSGESEHFSSNGIYINKINIYNIEFTQDTKCWWCKNSFTTPNLMLPENYNNGIFHCIGNFCSFNCKKAYNIDLNDSFVWKRESLINLEYYLTYNKYKKIDPAPSWLILKDFGGFLSITEFRKNFENNSSEYILLQPPLISRQMQIEESYKKSGSPASINKIDKLLTENSSYLLKRHKPIETSQLNLEKTMGLRKYKKP